MKLALLAMLALGISSASAATVDQLTFVRALKEGHAAGPLPAMRPFPQAAAAMQGRTGSKAPITVMSFLITRFTQQPSCGRIGFGLYQEATKTFWAEGGGQMNICSDGNPPNRICPDEPQKLVAFNASCPNGKKPVDTPEVAAAIAEAIKQGSLSIAEGVKRGRAIQDQHKE